MWIKLQMLQETLNLAFYEFFFDVQQLLDIGEIETCSKMRKSGMTDRNRSENKIKYRAISAVRQEMNRKLKVLRNLKYLRRRRGQRDDGKADAMGMMEGVI